MSWILFYDGECAFCSRSARWVARRDRGRLFEFASLQGRLASEQNLEQYADAGSGSLVLWNELSGELLLRSDALLEICRLLGWPWRALGLLGVVPRSFRDLLYRGFARHRHRWAGGGSSCPLPDEEFRARLREEATQKGLDDKQVPGA